MSQDEDDVARTLLGRVARGDQAALRDLFALWRPRIVGYCRRQLGGDAELAEDVAQETFVAIWRNAASYRGAARPVAWAFRVAHNLAANALRDRARRTAGHESDWPADDDPAAPATESAENRILDRLRLEDAFRTLSPAHLAALDLVFVQGFTLDEAARILDIPLGTLKSRLHNARRALRLSLNACPTEEIHHG